MEEDLLLLQLLLGGVGFKNNSAPALHPVMSPL